MFSEKRACRVDLHLLTCANQGVQREVHQALVNIEKDIRLEERRQKNTQNAPAVRWTASGDAADADVQTDDSGSKNSSKAPEKVSEVLAFSFAQSACSLTSRFSFSLALRIAHSESNTFSRSSRIRTVSLPLHGLLVGVARVNMLYYDSA